MSPWGVFALLVARALAADRMNVLMIAVDDLRPSGTAFGEPEILLPNLDKLASKSVAFSRAFVQAPTCGVSRTSLLTGRRPDTTEVLSNAGCPFTNNPDHKDWQSLPEYFRNNGYTTAGMGKIFHPNVCQGAYVGEWNASWTLPYYHAPCISLGSIYNGTCYESYPFALPGDHHKITHAYANETAVDEDMPDGMIAAHAVQTLRNISSSNSDEPFFVAVGFHKPHMPHIAPKKYFDLYSNVSLPAHENRPIDAPDASWNKCDEFKSYPDNAEAMKEVGFGENKPFNESWTRWSRHAYFAAASFTDAQIGKVLDELETLGLADSTVVVLWGDHGWHLGENNEWAKHTAYRRAARAPLLFHLPSSPAADVVTDAYAEFVDIFPTVADLAGLPEVPLCRDANMSATAAVCTEGASLGPVVRDPANNMAKKAAFYQWKIGKSTGYSLATRMVEELGVGAAADGCFYRYTEWVEAKDYKPVWDKNNGVELYNITADPEENVNIASKAPEELVNALKKVLHEGWRGMV